MSATTSTIATSEPFKHANGQLIVIYKTKENKEFIEEYDACKYILETASRKLSFLMDKESSKVRKSFLDFVDYYHRLKFEFFPRAYLNDLLSLLDEITERSRERLLQEIEVNQPNKRPCGCKRYIADMKVKEPMLLAILGFFPQGELVCLSETKYDADCHLQQFIEILHDLFISKVMSPHPYSEYKKPETKFVRAFTVGDSKFVIRDELNKALYEIYIDDFSPYDHKRNWYTYTEDQALKLAEKSGVEIEFVISPFNVLGDHGQTIKTPIGKDGKHSVHALLDISKEMLNCHGFGVIELFTNPELLVSVFKKHLNCFIGLHRRCWLDSTPVFFMSLECIEKKKKSLSAHRNYESHSVPEYYKELTEEAQRILLEWIYRDSRNTSICLLKTIPELATFIHSQKACHLFPTLTCCNKEDPEVTKLVAEYKRLTGLMQEIALAIREHYAENENNGKEVKTVADTDSGKCVTANQKIQKPATKEFGQQTTEPEPTECVKCINMRKYCADVRGECKTAQNLAKQRQKKLSEQEKKIKKLEECERKFTESEEKKKEFKKKWEEIKKSEKAIKLEVTRLEEENTELKVTTSALEQQLTKVQTELSILTPMSDSERSDVIWDLMNKKGKLTYEMPENMNKCNQLYFWFDNPHIREQIQWCKNDYSLKTSSYQKELETNLATIRGNLQMSRSVVPVISEYPMISKKIVKLYEQMLSQKEINECMVCDFPLEGRRLFFCTGCRNPIHLHCAEEWWKYKSTCIFCIRVVSN